MDEDFGAVAQFQTNSVERAFHDHRNGRISRCNDGVARRFDSDAVTHHLLGEGIVRHFADIDEVAGNEGFQLHGTVVFINRNNGFSRPSRRRFC